MATTPDLLVQIATRHQVYLEGHKARIARNFEKFLRKMEEDIVAQLAKVELETIKAARLKRLLDLVRAAMTEGFGGYEKAWRDAIRDLGAYEAEFEGRALKQAIAADFDIPSPAQVYTAAFARPLSVEGVDGGKLLAAFYRDWTARTFQRVEGAIRLGAAQGKTTQDVVRAIRGSRAAKYRDGLIEATRRDVTMMVRTSLQHVAAEARVQTWLANADIIEAMEFVAVLDMRTTALCRGLSGQRFPVGKGPQPPLHIGCRSQLVPAVRDGAKFFKGVGQQASRGEDGPKPVAADLTYYEWLKTQGAAFQDSVVGPTRGKLLREGGLTADQFQALQLDRTFKERTLDEMRALEPLAFERAGV